MARPGSDVHAVRRISERLLRERQLNAFETSDISRLYQYMEANVFDSPIAGQEGVEWLLAACKVALGDQGVPEFCRIAHRVLSKQKTPLKQTEAESLAKTLVAIATNSGKAHVKLDALRALNDLVRLDNASLRKVYAQVVPPVLELAQTNVRPLDVRRMSINCLGNLCRGAGSRLSSWYPSIYDVLVGNLEKATDVATLDASHRKVVGSIFRSLGMLYSQDPASAAKSKAHIIEGLHYATFRNTDHINLSNDVRYGVPEVRNLTVSSESEFSDMEQIRHERKANDGAKIRVHALRCLAALVKASPESFQPHWFKFLPETSDAYMQVKSATFTRDSLLTMINCDPEAFVRTAALEALEAMFQASKQYLAIAAERPTDKTTSSFMTLSEKLAGTIAQVHRGLMFALVNEKQDIVLERIFKTVEIIALSIPYDRLSSGYLTSLYVTLCNLLPSSGMPACTAAHEMFSRVPACRHALGLLYTIIHAYASKQEIKDCVLHHDVAKNDGNLISYLVNLLTDPEQELAQRAWSVLSACIKLDHDTAIDIYEKARPRLVDILARSLPVRVTAYSWLMECSTVFSQDVEWWPDVIDRFIPSMAEDEPNIRMIAANCIANMDQTVFDSLPDPRQTLVVTLTFGLTSDEEADVRASACRTIGVLVLFESLRKDSLFISDVADVLVTQCDQDSVSVKVRASWGLGNLCDALVLVLGHHPLSDLLSFGTFQSILATSIRLMSADDKISPNGIRAFGSLLRCAPKLYLDQVNLTNALQTLSHIITCTAPPAKLTSPKVGWNTCFAAANLIRNDIKHPSLITALMYALERSPNYKVRIQACQALSLLPSNPDVDQCLARTLQHLPEPTPSTARYHQQLVAALAREKHFPPPRG